MLNKKLESGQNFLNILMHFFQIFLHEIFKDPLKVLNKKLKLGQKILHDFCSEININHSNGIIFCMLLVILWIRVVILANHSIQNLIIS